jgi:hypothetical protein
MEIVVMIEDMIVVVEEGIEIMTGAAGMIATVAEIMTRIMIVVERITTRITTGVRTMIVDTENAAETTTGMTVMDAIGVTATRIERRESVAFDRTVKILS